MSVLGLDIGGANLKAADETGRALSERFEIWRAPGELAARLTAIVSQFPECDALAVTMTAELADCFETRARGVDHIVRAVVQDLDRRPPLIQVGAVHPECRASGTSLAIQKSGD